MTKPAFTPVDICPIEPEQAPHFAELIAEAFQPLAISKWLAPDPDARLRMQTGQFSMLVEHALHNGAGYTIPGGGAAAIWKLHLNHIDTPVPMRADYNARLRQLTGDEHYERFAALDRAMDDRKPKRMVWHLMFLAVSPELQGQGIGSALLDRHHARMDRSGQVAYLEAADQRSAKLYERHGYTAAGEPFRAQVGPLGLRDAARVLLADEPDEAIYGPPFYPMQRHPKTRQAQPDMSRGWAAA